MYGLLLLLLLLLLRMNRWGFVRVRVKRCDGGADWSREVTFMNLIGVFDIGCVWPIF